MNPYIDLTDQELRDKIDATKRWLRTNHQYNQGRENPKYNQVLYGRGMRAIVAMVNEYARRKLGS